jgi:Domain of Unknown Function (DUF1080)
MKRRRNALDAVAEARWFKESYLPRHVEADPKQSSWHNELGYNPVKPLEALNVPALMLFGDSDPWIERRRADGIAHWSQRGDTLETRRMRSTGIAACVVTGLTACASRPAQQPETGPAVAAPLGTVHALFDGQSLSEWRGYCREAAPESWRVEDGALRLTPSSAEHPGAMAGADLVTREDYETSSSPWNGKSPTTATVASSTSSPSRVSGVSAPRSPSMSQPPRCSCWITSATRTLEWARMAIGRRARCTI